MMKLYIERFYLNRGQRRIPYDCTYHPFLDELHQQGLTYEIPDRHPLQIAPITDYRNTKPK